MSLEFGEFELDQERRQLLRAGRPVPLEPKAYELLCLLVERRPRALSRAQIRDVVWPDTFITESTLGVAVNALRQALEDDAHDPRFIRTVRGFGFTFCGEVREESKKPGAAGDSRPDPAAARVGARGRWRSTLLGWPAALVALSVGAAVWVSPWREAPSKALPPMKVVPLTNLPGWEASPVLSPDGSRVAFSRQGESADSWDIYVKQVGTEALLRLTRDPGDDNSPAWSPDGLHIAFSRQTATELAYFIVSALGGPERRVHTFQRKGGVEVNHLDWSPDGKSLAFSRSSGDPPEGIVLLSIETLEAAPPVAASAIASRPAFSPDGRELAYVALSSNTVGAMDIYVVATSGGEPRRLTFDNQLVHGLAWTRDGREGVFSSGRAGQPGLWRVAASGGTPEPVSPGGEGAGWVSIARDADRLAYERTVHDLNIWQVAVGVSARRGGRLGPVTASTANESEPHFSPDGSRITFASNRSGYQEIWACQADDSGCVQLSSLEAPVCGAPRWSPDGREVAFNGRPEGSFDVFVVDVDTRVARPLTRDPAHDSQPSWSRDGRWVYFGSDRSGSWQVWKTPATGGRAVQVTTGGGWRARESPDGAFLYFCRTMWRGDIWRVPVKGGEETPLLEVPDGFAWDVGEKGLYYLDGEAQPHPVVELFDPVASEVTRVAEFEGTPFGRAGLAISPDGRSILYVQMDTDEHDLMLIENFR